MRVVDCGLKIPEIEIPFIPEVDATSWARSLKFRDELPRVLRLLPLAASGVEGKTHHNLLCALVLRELRHTPRDEGRVVDAPPLRGGDLPQPLGDLQLRDGVELDERRARDVALRSQSRTFATVGP